MRSCWIPACVDIHLNEGRSGGAQNGEKKVRRARGGEAGRRRRKWRGCVQPKAAARRASNPAVFAVFRAVRPRPEFAVPSLRHGGRVRLGRRRRKMHCWKALHRILQEATSWIESESFPHLACVAYQLVYPKVEAEEKLCPQRTVRMMDPQGLPPHCSSGHFWLCYICFLENCGLY